MWGGLRESNFYFLRARLKAPIHRSSGVLIELIEYLSPISCMYSMLDSLGHLLVLPGLPHSNQLPF